LVEVTSSGYGARYGAKTATKTTPRTMRSPKMAVYPLAKR